MSSIILCNLSDKEEVVNEERSDWTNRVLFALGVTEEIINCNDIDEFREKMEEMGIEVELNTSGIVTIYKKEWHSASEKNSGWLPVSKSNIVAQWNTPKYIRKVEGKDVYYEIHLNEWSILNTRK